MLQHVEVISQTRGTAAYFVAGGRWQQVRRVAAGRQAGDFNWCAFVWNLACHIVISALLAFLLAPAPDSRYDMTTFLQVSMTTFLQSQHAPAELRLRGYCAPLESG